MPRADVAAMVIDLRGLWMFSGECKERGGRWLIQIIISCYCMNMEEVSSFVRRICNWKSLSLLYTSHSRGSKGSGFSRPKEQKGFRKFLCVEMLLIRTVCQCSVQLGSCHLSLPNQKKVALWAKNQFLTKVKTKLKKKAEESDNLLEIRIKIQVMSERSKAEGSSNRKVCRYDALLRTSYLRIAHLSKGQADMF